jgi:hypothetical protein
MRLTKRANGNGPVKGHGMTPSVRVLMVYSLLVRCSEFWQIPERGWLLGEQSTLADILDMFLESLVADESVDVGQELGAREMRQDVGVLLCFGGVGDGFEFGFIGVSLDEEVLRLDVVLAHGGSSG